MGRKNLGGGRNSPEIGLPKGGVYSLEDFVEEEEGGSKNKCYPVEFAILISNVG